MSIDYTEKLRWSRELASRVQSNFDPYAVIVAYTSGGDSNIALKLATMFFKVDAAFTCDTTIASIETLMQCEKVAKDHYNLKYIVRQPPYGGMEQNPNTYFELVKQHGFPGKTRTAHAWMYRYLKDHTVGSIVASIRQRRKNRPVVIISGARRDESIRRMSTSNDITVTEKGIWVNIANEWTASDCEAFSQDNNLDRLRSPISRFMGISGECWCGAYAQPGQKEELKMCSPSTVEKIDRIAKHLKGNTPFYWDWEQSPPKSFTLEKHGQQNLFYSMCSTCMNNPCENG